MLPLCNADVLQDILISETFSDSLSCLKQKVDLFLCNELTMVMLGNTEDVTFIHSSPYKANSEQHHNISLEVR